MDGDTTRENVERLEAEEHLYTQSRPADEAVVGSGMIAGRADRSFRREPTLDARRSTGSPCRGKAHLLVPVQHVVGYRGFARSCSSPWKRQRRQHLFARDATEESGERNVCLDQEAKKIKQTTRSQAEE